MLGFMGVTAFLSMWISNTATTAMMAPIVQAILDQLNAKAKSESSSFKGQSAVAPQEHEENDSGLLQSASPNTLANGTTVTQEPKMYQEKYICQESTKIQAVFLLQRFF